MIDGGITSVNIPVYNDFGIFEEASVYPFIDKASEVQEAKTLSVTEGTLLLVLA